MFISTYPSVILSYPKIAFANSGLPAPISPKKPKSTKRKVPKKTREINLYSPEYLAKKHGIKIKDSEPKASKGSIPKDKVSFGFYSSLLVFLVFIIFFSRSL